MREMSGPPLVARHFGCRKSAVSIKRGATGRRKLIEIESP
jgi:uncharacterized protein YggU (UPF0235/DUF167 family)